MGLVAVLQIARLATPQTAAAGGQRQRTAETMGVERQDVEMPVLAAWSPPLTIEEQPAGAPRQTAAGSQVEPPPMIEGSQHAGAPQWTTVASRTKEAQEMCAVIQQHWTIVGLPRHNVGLQPRRKVKCAQTPAQAAAQLIVTLATQQRDASRRRPSANFPELIHPLIESVTEQPIAK